MTQTDDTAKPTPPPIVDHPTARHFGLLVLLAAIWGSSFLFIKIAVESVPAASITAGRIVIAALILTAVVQFRRDHFPKGWRIWSHYLAIGLMGNALPFTLIAWGEVGVSSGLAAILIAMTPLYTLVLAHLFTSDEKMNTRRVIGVLTGFCGVVLLIGSTAAVAGGSDVIRQISVALGGVSFAVAAILTKRLPPNTHAVNSAGVLIAATILWVPVVLVVDQPWQLDPSFQSVASICALGLLSTAIGTLIYLYLVRQCGVNFGASNNFLTPVFGVFWGALLLHEAVDPNAVFSLLLILAGIAITQFRSRRPARHSTGDKK